MNLSIIIVNYKTPQLVVECISSIVNSVHATEIEFIVVDNDSNDGSSKIVMEAFPQVRWIDMGYNSGFARANNAGIKIAKAPIVLLLNSDTLDLENAVENCFLTFTASSYSACGVQLLNEDGTPQISGNFIMRGALNNLLPLPYLGDIMKFLGSVLKVKKPHVPDCSSEMAVDWINGAFLMVKKSAIEKAGLLDEDFFLYAEEAEWCSRLKRTGPLCIYGQYKIVHLQGASANSSFGSSGKGYYNLSDKKGLQIMVSNFVRIRKQFGVGWFLIQLLIYTLAVLVWFVLSTIDHLLHLKNPGSDYKKVSGFAGNVSRLWGLSTTIISNKPFFYKML